MRPVLRVIALLILAAAPATAQQQEIDNVAAFARLYGVARWFYPSDAAAALDWNRFAVHGVSRVRAARTPADLERTLEELFTPLGPGIDIGRTLPPKPAPGAPDASLVAWRYRGAGLVNRPGPYNAKRVNRTAPPANDQANAYANFAQVLRADTLRTKTVRLRARVRVTDPNLPGWAGLWVRIDRGNQMGFFDNMQDRPVRDTAWREYVIEGKVDPDATRIVFGGLALEGMSADFDAMEISVRDAAGAWNPIPFPDAGFEEDADRKHWMQSNVRGNYLMTRLTSGAAEGTRFLRLAQAPLTPVTTQAQAPADTFETPVAGASIDVELPRGLKARVPLALTDADAKVPAVEPPLLGGLRAALTTLADPRRRDDADVRLADAVVAWNVFRHFYPYWGDIGVDWDARLRAQLETARTAAENREGHLDALRALVAELRDGHGSVRDVVTPQRLGMLPLQYRFVENKLVVTASGDANVPVGSVVTSIAGVPAAERAAKELRLASGTLQWRQTRAVGALPLCPRDVPAKLTIEPPSGATREVTLPCDRPATRLTETRPDSVAELQPGIWYVDLTRVRAAQLRDVVDKVATARGVVFDMRGYPTDIGFAILPHLVGTAEDDKWMHVSRIAGPFGQIVDWHSVSWNVQPAMPQIRAQRVWLTDGRAISYAESVMGYVRDHKLGTIVGGTTAGANGNIADFGVPGGFSIVFTGMRVTRHDGKTPYHTAGVSADIPVEPTVAGIRAGRDEVLERGLSVFRVQP